MNALTAIRNVKSKTDKEDLSVVRTNPWLCSSSHCTNKNPKVSKTLQVDTVMSSKYLSWIKCYSKKFPHECLPVNKLQFTLLHCISVSLHKLPLKMTENNILAIYYSFLLCILLFNSQWYFKFTSSLNHWSYANIFLSHCCSHYCNVYFNKKTHSLNSPPPFKRFLLLRMLCLYDFFFTNNALLPLQLLEQFPEHCRNLKQMCIPYPCWWRTSNILCHVMLQAESSASVPFSMSGFWRIGQ